MLGPSESFWLSLNQSVWPRYYSDRTWVNFPFTQEKKMLCCHKKGGRSERQQKQQMSMRISIITISGVTRCAKVLQ